MDVLDRHSVRVWSTRAALGSWWRKAVEDVAKAYADLYHILWCGTHWRALFRNGQGARRPPRAIPDILTWIAGALISGRVGRPLSIPCLYRKLVRRRGQKASRVLLTLS
jgi:hypothetical protein